MALSIACMWISSREECREGPGWMRLVMGVYTGSVKAAETSGMLFS